MLYNPGGPTRHMTRRLFNLLTSLSLLLCFAAAVAWAREWEPRRPDRLPMWSVPPAEPWGWRAEWTAWRRVARPGDQVAIVAEDLIGPGVVTQWSDTVAGADDITGGNDDDDLFGDAGDDTIAGNDGDDTISGGADNDTLLGNADNDAIQGNTGDDFIDGDGGDDDLMGGDGADNMLGGDGFDVMLGDDGVITATATLIPESPAAVLRTVTLASTGTGNDTMSTWA